MWSNNIWRREVNCFWNLKGITAIKSPSIVSLIIYFSVTLIQVITTWSRSFLFNLDTESLENICLRKIYCNNALLLLLLLNNYHESWLNLLVDWNWKDPTPRPAPPPRTPTANILMYQKEMRILKSNTKFTFHDRRRNFIKNVKEKMDKRLQSRF